jgi:hypothetical protein
VNHSILPLCEMTWVSYHSVYSSYHCRNGSRDSVVGIATGYGLRGRNSSLGRVKNFFFSTSSRQVLGSTQSPIQWVPGALSPGVKRLGV